jgi:uncharacterized protein (AIM24 family)
LEKKCNIEIELDPQEIVIADPGSFMMMDNKIQMETILRWFRAKSGIFGQLLNAGKRVLTGESLFMTAFINQDNVKKRFFCGSLSRKNSTHRFN